jgi:hypothetical protein
MISMYTLGPLVQQTSLKFGVLYTLNYFDHKPLIYCRYKTIIANFRVKYQHNIEL